MTDGLVTPSKEAYEEAVRSFTEAEVALREIVASVQRYRAATDVVFDAGAALTETRDSVLAALRTLETAGATLSGIAGDLAHAAAVVGALDPDRFWRAFAALDETTKSSAAAMTDAQAAAASRIEAAVSAASLAHADALRQAAATLETGQATSAQSIQGGIDAATAEVTSVNRTSTEVLRVRVEAAAAEVTAANRSSSQDLHLALDEVRKVAIHARAFSTATAVIAMVVLVAMAALLVR